MGKHLARFKPYKFGEKRASKYVTIKLSKYFESSKSTKELRIFYLKDYMQEKVKTNNSCD